jgi:hypothetical protein
MHRLSRSTWVWPALILVSTVSAGLVILVPAAAATPVAIALRPALVMLFLFICPGMVIVRFFRLGDPVAELVLALALSLTSGAFVAGIFLYAGLWSPVSILNILLGFCLGGAVLQLLLPSLRWLIAARSLRREQQAHSNDAH